MSLTAGKVLVSGVGGAVTTSNLDAGILTHLQGVLGNVQLSLDAKQDKLQGSAVDSAPTVDRIVVTDANGRMITSPVSAQLMSRLDLIDTGSSSPLSVLLASKSPVLSLSSPLSIVGGNVVSMPPATSSNSGYLRASDHSLFSSKQNALAQASATQNGYLGSSDWSAFNGKQNAITGAASTVTASNLSSSVVVATNASGKIVASTVGIAKLNTLANARSDIQAQLDAKQNLIVGAASSATASNFTRSVAVVTDASGKLASSSVPSQALAHVSGLSSDAQNQLDSKQGTITGACTSTANANLLGNSIVITNTAGKFATSDIVSANVLSHLTGLRSNVQAQLDALVSAEPPTVVGSRGGNVALANLIAILASLGLVADGTSP